LTTHHIPADQDIPVFTVEAMPGARIRVSWSDASTDFHFTAATEGDRITEVLGGIGRRMPTVWSRDQSRGARTVSHDAERPEFAPTVAALRADIERRGLISEAFTEYRAAKAEKDAATIARKAAVMQREFTALGLSNIPPLAPADLAAAFDRIQDAQW